MSFHHVIPSRHSITSFRHASKPSRNHNTCQLTAHSQRQHRQVTNSCTRTSSTTGSASAGSYTGSVTVSATDLTTASKNTTSELNTSYHHTRCNVLLERPDSSKRHRHTGSTLHPATCWTAEPFLCEERQRSDRASRPHSHLRELPPCTYNPHGKQPASHTTQL